MTPDQIEKAVDIVEEGLEEAVKIGMLIPVPHGYCFYCDTETAVYDATTVGDIPAQPPICRECIICLGVSMLAQRVNEWYPFSK